MDKEFRQFLEESSISEDDYPVFEFLAESLKKEELNEFATKSFLIQGDPGVGKTYFVENLIKKLNLPIIFLGPFSLEHSEVTSCKNLKEVYTQLKKVKEAAVFLDDLQNTLQTEYSMGECMVQDSERKIFLNLLEHLKRSKEKKVLFMTLNDDEFLESSWIDRIESRIFMDEPKEAAKEKFLAKKYSKLISKPLIKEISERTMGYSFRNLEDVLKIAYCEGNGTITKDSVKKAISNYSLPALSRYEVIQDTETSFKDVVGNEKLKNDLAFLKQYLKHPKFFKKNQIESSNVLMFSGPPGVGKTHMVKALAGELDIPLVNVRAVDLINPAGPLIALFRISKLARRLRNCIIFVDEFDKVIGQPTFSEDTATLAGFEEEIDGIKERTKCIVILALNQKSRFGAAFHDRIPCFSFSYPSEAERREFLKIKMQASEIDFSESQLNAIVRQTENTSYRQIKKIWNDILFNLMEKQGAEIQEDKLIANPDSIEKSVKEVLRIASEPNRNNLSMFG